MYLYGLELSPLLGPEMDLVRNFLFLVKNYENPDYGNDHGKLANSWNFNCKILWEPCYGLVVLIVLATDKHNEYNKGLWRSKRCCDTTMPESIHTNDESKRGSAFAFIFGVN